MACAANEVGSVDRDEPEPERPGREQADAGDLPIRPDVGSPPPSVDAGLLAPDAAADIDAGTTELLDPADATEDSDSTPPGEDVVAAPPDTTPVDDASTEGDTTPVPDAGDPPPDADPDVMPEPPATLTFQNIELPETANRIVEGALEVGDYRAARPTGSCTTLAEETWIDGYAITNPGPEPVTLQIALRTGLDDAAWDLFGGNVVYYGADPVPETLVPCVAAGVATDTTTGTLQNLEVAPGATVRLVVTGAGDAPGTYALSVGRADGGVAPGGISATDIVLGPGARVALPGALTAGDAEWVRPSERCTVFGSARHYVDAYRIINPTSQALTLDVIVETEWGGLDAYLHVFDGSATGLDDLGACYEGIDDDLWDYDDAALLDRVLRPNAAVYLLVSSWASGAQGAYTLRVLVTRAGP